MRRRFKIHAPRRISRRGLRVSRKVHFARLIAYMILIPVLTWYGHQRYTNPFMHHPNIQFREVNGGLILSLFETSYRDTVNKFDLYFDDISVIENGAEKFYLSDKGFLRAGDSLWHETITHPNFTGVLNHASIILNYFEWSFVVPLNNAQPLLRKECDILVVAHDNSDQLFQLREKYAPRLTICRDSNLERKFLPSNIYVHGKDETINIKKRPYRELLVEKNHF